MGRNLETLFRSMAGMDDAAIRSVHPAHDRRSIEAAVPRFHHFEEGTCVVHHMFGDDVVRRVRRDHPDAMVAAHLEVPGEMFALAMEGARSDRGVVGSTSNILAFIVRKVEETAARGEKKRLQFVLGTEAGMITSIVREVQAALRARPADGPVEAEIVFPVAAEAVAPTPDRELVVVPGSSGGEGCSTAGGCATCPYMKMNSLEALLALLRRLGGSTAELAAFHPKPYTERVGARSAAELGSEPTLHMRHFQRTKRLPDALVDDVRRRAARSTA
jgi:quinolinate synthase